MQQRKHTVEAHTHIKSGQLLLISELDVALETLTKPPIRRNNIESYFGSSIAKLNFERERLTVEVSVALPVSSPIS